MAKRAVEKPVSTQAKPVLKWAGGKTQLLDALLPKVPASYGRYENIVLSQLELNRLKAAGSVAANNIENVFSKTQEIR